MKVSYNWLKDYVEIPLSPQELAAALTARGVVVEELHSNNPGVEGVVVGRVVEIEHHPDADTLWICQVDVGGGQVLQIITGAQNVRQGNLVPAAVPGSKLPGMKMKSKKLRGIESHGMLCSPDELGFADGGHEGILILPEDAGLEPGMDVAEVLGLNDWIMELDLTANYASHCQCMLGVAREVAAILGTDVHIPETYAPEAPNTDVSKLISVRIDEPALCSRYVARVVKGIQVKESPLWLQTRIRAAGMRPINNIVDIANFVMLELGQPLHTFDYNKIGGRQIIVRRGGVGERFTTLDGQERVLDPDILVIADGNRPVALAGVMGGEDSEVTDATTDILIESAHFDNINNRRTALRMNLPSEASSRFTKGVDPSGCLRAANRAAQLMVELAGGTLVAGHLDVCPRPATPPVIVLRTQRVNALLGLTLSAERMAEHLSRLHMAVLTPADLAADLAAGKPEPGEGDGEELGGRPVWTAIHQASPVPQDPEVYAAWADAAWASLEKAGERMENLREKGNAGEGDLLVVVVPTARLDVAEEVDLVEEIARSEGYDAIPTELPPLASSRGGRSAMAEKVLAARRHLAGAGLDEVLTHSLTYPRVFDRLGLPADSPYRKAIALQNPLYEDRSILRTMLLPGLLDTLLYNANRQVRDLGIFEISHVYRPREGQQLPDEPWMLGIALMGDQAEPGWRSAGRPADFFLLKGIIADLLDILNIRDWKVERGDHPALHPGRQATLLVNGQPCGTFGELHPAVQKEWELPSPVLVAELAFEPLAQAGQELREYRPVSRFPAVTRDVAVVVGQELSAAQVEEAIRTAGGKLVAGVLLFDLYQGERMQAGKRSLAFRITYQVADRTLTDAEVEKAHGKVREALQRLGAELRS